MTIFKLGLYSVGFYLESDGVRNLPMTPGISVKEAVEIIWQKKWEWSIRIVPLRNGSMSHLRDALCRRLAQRSDPNTDDIASFKSLFSNSKLEYGVPLLFEWTKTGPMIVSKDQDQRLGTITSAWTSRSLLDIYAGPESPAVPHLVDDLNDTLSRLQ